jgi:hypothetical protein
MKKMRRGLRLVAAALFSGALAFWVVMGANRGWTKTRVPVKTLDEVLGIEGIHYEKRFVPGVDFLAAAFVAAAVLAGASLFPGNRKH